MAPLPDLREKVFAQFIQMRVCSMSEAHHQLLEKGTLFTDRFELIN